MGYDSGASETHEVMPMAAGGDRDCEIYLSAGPDLALAIGYALPTLRQVVAEGHVLPAGSEEVESRGFRLEDRDLEPLGARSGLVVLGWAMGFANDAARRAWLAETKAKGFYSPPRPAPFDVLEPERYRREAAVLAHIGEAGQLLVEAVARKTGHEPLRAFAEKLAAALDRVKEAPLTESERGGRR